MIRFAAEKLLSSPCVACTRRLSIKSRVYYQELESKYSDIEKERILQILNEADTETLSRYNITKIKLKKLIDWRNKNGKVKSITDIELIEGFTEKSTSKLCSNLLQGPQNNEPMLSKKIKGQVLHPTMPEAVRKHCKTVLAVYVTVNSLYWTLIDRNSYEVVEWKYQAIEYFNSKSIKISDILTTAWNIANQLPAADVYVMKAEATSLRAAGSDPNNPKVLGINLQKAQMISMIVALINARFNGFAQENYENDDTSNKLVHKVYFLRPTLPFRLHGTLVGNERVSTDQTVEMLLQQSNGATRDHTQVYVPGHLQSMFRSQRDLEKDMLGHCLLLAITFMDVCVYMNRKSIEKLIKRGE